MSFGPFVLLWNSICIRMLFWVRLMHALQHLLIRSGLNYVEEIEFKVCVASSEKNHVWITFPWGFGLLVVLFSLVCIKMHFFDLFEVCYTGLVTLIEFNSLWKIDFNSCVIWSDPIIFGHIYMSSVLGGPLEINCIGMRLQETCNAVSNDLNRLKFCCKYWFHVFVALSDPIMLDHSSMSFGLLTVLFSSISIRMCVLDLFLMCNALLVF